MKWRNSKERELLANGGSRDQTLPNKNNPNPDLSDAKCDRLSVSPSPPPAVSEDLTTSTICSNVSSSNCISSMIELSPTSISKGTDFLSSEINNTDNIQRQILDNIQSQSESADHRLYFDEYDDSNSDSDEEISVT